MRRSFLVPKGLGSISEWLLYRRLDDELFRETRQEHGPIPRLNYLSRNSVSLHQSK
jgi:hypothetical protein